MCSAWYSFTVKSAAACTPYILVKLKGEVCDISYERLCSHLVSGHRVDDFVEVRCEEAFPEHGRPEADLLTRVCHVRDGNVRAGDPACVPCWEVLAREGTCVWDAWPHASESSISYAEHVRPEVSPFVLGGKGEVLFPQV